VTTGVPGSLVGVVPNHVDARGGPVLARVIHQVIADRTAAQWVRAT
jgi:hypothetical protein